MVCGKRLPLFEKSTPEIPSLALQRLILAKAPNFDFVPPDSFWGHFESVKLFRRVILSERSESNCEAASNEVPTGSPTEKHEAPHSNLSAGLRSG